jgi:hypothetical protein
MVGADLNGVRNADLAGGAKQANSTHCSTGDQCNSTYCVDGYCCEVPCAGQCQACDIKSFEGQCMAVTSGQPHGARSHCLGLDAGVCAGQCGTGSTTSCTYPGPSTQCSAQSCTGSTKSLASGCNQGGACNAQMTVPCNQGCSGNNCLGACTTDNECVQANPAKPYCQVGPGTCTATKPNGYACNAGSECFSTFCADGVCCSARCDQQCQSCKGIAGVAAVGTCGTVNGAVVTGDVPARTACKSDGSSCGGTCDGTHLTCVYAQSGALCGQCCHAGKLDSCDGNGSCKTSDCPTATCVATPGPGSCSATFQACNSNGGCSANAQCASGTCLGGGCCSAPPCPGLPGSFCDVTTGACGCAPTNICNDCGSGDDGCGNSCDNCTNGIDLVCCSHTCRPGSSC